MALPADPHPLRRLMWLVTVSAFVLFALGLCVHHQRMHGTHDDVSHTAEICVLVGPELALHTSNRWMRHPLRSEPWAAGSDGPSLLDLDPAGALQTPLSQSAHGIHGVTIVVRHTR